MSKSKVRRNSMDLPVNGKPRLLTFQKVTGVVAIAG
jgi:hypothetical protein